MTTVATDAIAPESLKACSGCGVEKTKAEFYVSRHTPSGVPVLSQPCIECKKPRMRQHYSENRERLSARSLERWHELSEDEKQMVTLLRKYGISLGDYDQMYEQQSGQCAICETEKAPRGRDRLVVDHCHTTGKVRGLLCHKCNRGIGFLNDDPSIVSMAVDYLTGTRS